MITDDALTQLSFTVSGYVSRPPDQVYEAIADPAQLARYFTTGGATGRLEPGADVTWEFVESPGAFPVTVVEAVPPSRIVIEWDGKETTDERGVTRTVFELEPVDDGTRTLVTITETGWRATAAGADAAFGNCQGWTGMLAALKVHLEHGINLRDRFYR